MCSLVLFMCKIINFTLLRFGLQHLYGQPKSVLSKKKGKPFDLFSTQVTKGSCRNGESVNKLERGFNIMLVIVVVL